MTLRSQKWARRASGLGRLDCLIFLRFARLFGAFVFAGHRGCLLWAVGGERGRYERVARDYRTTPRSH